MKKKIEQLVDQHGIEKIKRRSVPMTNGQYIVKEDDLDELGEQGRVLNDDERREYQSLVGSMMWIGGLRHDISFSLNYLAGNGKNPRVHHLRVAEQVLGYLWSTSEVMLTLGGEEGCQITDLLTRLMGRERLVGG
jgi:hypothetical protein